MSRGRGVERSGRSVRLCAVAAARPASTAAFSAAAVFWAAGDWLRLIRLEEEAWRLNNWSENPYYTGTTVDSQSVARQAKLLAEIATLKAANRAAMDAFEKLSPVEEVRP